MDIERSTRLLSTLLILSATTLLATILATLRGRHGFGASATMLAIVAIVVAPLYALLTLAVPIHVGDAEATGVTISPWGMRCALLAAGVGLTAMLSLGAALRRAVLVISGMRGAVIGAAAGAWAGLAVFVFCPSGDRLHLLVGHVLPVIALTVTGLVLLPRSLRP